MEDDDNNNTDNKGFNMNLEQEMQFPDGGIFSKVIAKGDTYNYTLMCLSKGTDIETHTSAKQGVVYVLKGKGNFRLFDKDIEMTQGELIFMPKGAPHSLDAEEDLAILLCLSE